MTYKAEKKKRRRTGKASLGWHLGFGFVQEWITIKFECWCVTKDGEWYCDASSKKAAHDIANAMENTK